MRNLNLPFDSTTLHKWYKRAWLREHWGLISEVANNLNVSPQFVRLVYWGERRSERVERALRRRGACLCGHERNIKHPPKAGNI
jgi:hypothetical protein